MKEYDNDITIPTLTSPSKYYNCGFISGQMKQPPDVLTLFSPLFFFSFSFYLDVIIILIFS